ncbi:MAG: ABC transporter permease [Clostridia bacterium]|jgi:putative ABC transport system permease protein|nr:ABC transporter permease [Clostridia bacterium]
MRKLFLVARSNMRKAKGQTVAIVVLILLASMLLNLWLMLSMDYKANFDRYHKKLNAEHVTLLVNDTDGVPKFLTQMLENDSEVKEYRLNSCMYMVGTFPYNGGQMNGQFVFMDKQTALSRAIGKAEIVEEGKFTSGVYLPMLYKSDDFSVGKTMEMTIGSHAVTYTVCGFFNSVMLGSHNCALTQIILTQDQYAELEESNYAFQTTLCSVRLNEKSNNLAYEAKIKAFVSERFPNTQMASNCYDIVSQARYISQGICSVIMSVMAFLVLLIAMVVIVSNIINYIQVNIKNLGALKAMGYTSRQLVLSFLLQFLGLAVIAALVGAALSYALFPAINTMMIAQTGIPYAIHFLPFPVLISLLILGGAVSLSVWISARRIKKIEPIVALRSGVQTHNFKKNRVPLEKTKLPLNFALALKTTLSGVKHNLTVCITMLVLSLVVVFSGLMTENIIVDMTPFLDLIVGETADSAINVQVETEDGFLKMLHADGRVEKVYLYNSLNVSHVGGVELMATLCDDFSMVNNQSVVFKGRFPKYDNEIAIAAKYAKEKGFEVGNEIDITANGKTEKYLISGFTQITNNLGRDCLLTRQGYERLGKLTSVTYYINLAEGTDIDAFNEEVKGNFTDSVNGVINVLATIEGAGKVYVSLMTIIVIAILVLSAIIIAFVLYILVRTLLNSKKRDYGILKSFGFTTKQLILQTAFSFMPAIIFSIVIGIIISCLVINPLMSLFLSTMGIVKCTFNIPILFVTVAGTALILLSFGIACLLSLKIKKISPHSLLVGE